MTFERGFRSVALVVAPLVLVMGVPVTTHAAPPGDPPVAPADAADEADSGPPDSEGEDSGAPEPEDAEPEEAEPEEAEPGDEEPEPEEAEPGEDPEPAADNGDKGAPELFHEGQDAYNLGHYESAVSKFEAAWELSGEPALLFNIGQAYWQWHSVVPDVAYLRRAKQLFENYDKLLSETEGYDSAEVEGIIAALVSQITAAEQADLILAEMSQAPPSFDHAAARAEQRHRTDKALTISGSVLITLGSLGIATGIAGLIIRGAAGYSLKQAGGGEQGQTNPNSPEDDARQRELYELGGKIAFGGLIGGGVVLPVGIALRVTGGVRTKKERERRDLVVAPGPGLLSVQF